MQFSNIIIDDTLGSLLNDGSIFKASVIGVYKFSLFLSLDVSSGYGFEIEVQVNDESMQRFSKNSDEHEFLRSETFEFDFQLILSENDILRNFHLLPFSNPFTIHSHYERYESYHKSLVDT